MNHKTLAAILSPIVVLIVIFVVVAGRSRIISSPAVAAVAPPAVPVEVVRPTRQDLMRRVVLVGSIEPWAKAMLYAKAGGYVKTVLVDKGDVVRRGQLLAVLEVPEMRQEVAQARAMSQVAAAEIKQAAAEHQSALRDFESARAMVKQPQAELRTAEADLERAKRRLTVAERANEGAQEQSKEPEVGLLSAQADLRTAKTQALEPEAEIIAAKASLEAARSEVQAAQAELERSAADVTLHKRTYARYKPLAEREVITQQTLDEVKARLDTVMAGALAAQANAGSARGRMRAAEAQVAAAEARKDTAEERIRGADTRVKMAQQQIATARAQVKTPAARVDVDRAYVTSMERNLATLQARVEIAHANVEAVRARQETPKAKQQAARARLDNARANLARLTTLMNYAKIEAPFDGIVTDRFVDVGAMVQTATSSSSAQPIVTVMDMRKLRVFADVTEPDAPFVSLGKPAVVTVRELPGREFKGTVTRTEHALDPGSRNLRVEVDLKNTDGALRAGMFAEVRLGLETRPNVITIPARCLIVEKQKKSVFVVRGGQAKKVEVVTGADDGIQVEITSGLSAEDQVLISGMTQVKDGMSVTARTISDQ